MDVLHFPIAFALLDFIIVIRRSMRSSFLFELWSKSRVTRESAESQQISCKLNFIHMAATICADIQPLAVCVCVCVPLTEIPVAVWACIVHCPCYNVESIFRVRCVYFGVRSFPDKIKQSKRNLQFGGKVYYICMGISVVVCIPYVPISVCVVTKWHFAV